MTETVAPDVELLRELREARESSRRHYDQRSLAENEAVRLKVRVQQLERAGEHFRETGDPHQLYFALGWRPATHQELREGK